MMHGPNLRRRAPGDAGGGGSSVPTPAFLWQLNEGSGDRVAALGGLNLLEVGSVGSATGKFGDAASFDGSGATNRLVNGTIDAAIRTIGFWWKPTAGSPAGNQVLAGQNVSGPADVRFHVYENQARDSVVAADSFWTATLALGQSIGTWYYLMAVLEDQGATSTPKISANGGAFAPDDFGGEAFSNMVAVSAGSGFNGNLPSYSDIDQLALWTEELTLANAVELYNGGSGIPLP